MRGRICEEWILALSLSLLFGGDEVVMVAPVVVDTVRCSVITETHDSTANIPTQGWRAQIGEKMRVTERIAPLDNTISAYVPECIAVNSRAVSAGLYEQPPQLQSLVSPFHDMRAGGDDLGEYSVRLERSALIFSGLSGVGYAIHLSYRKELWWETRGSFHFAYDPGYAKNIDKLGHATVWYFVSATAWMLYRWVGYSDMESRWLGFGTAALFHLETEGHEGFSRSFGFDPVDYLAGISGGALIVARGYWPELERFTLKWSFVPRSTPTYTRREPWLKDYRAQKYWACLDVYDGWSVAVGFNLSRYENGLGKLQVWLSPDFRFTSLGDSEFLYLLDFLKLPLPAVQVHPDLRFVWVAWLN